MTRYVEDSLHVNNLISLFILFRYTEHMRISSQGKVFLLSLLTSLVFLTSTTYTHAQGAEGNGGVTIGIVSSGQTGFTGLPFTFSPSILIKSLRM